MNNSVFTNLIIYRKMYQFLERHKLQKKLRELNHLNRSISIKESDESIGRNKTAIVHR